MQQKIILTIGLLPPLLFRPCLLCLLKILLKRVARKGGKKMSDGLIVLLFILGLIGIGALIVWLLGWAWLGVIGLLALLLLAYGKKSPN